MAEEKSKRQKRKRPAGDLSEAISQADGNSVSSPPLQEFSGSGRITDYLVGTGPSTMDTSGEVGHPSGKGTLEIDEQQVSSEPIPDAQQKVGERDEKPRRDAA